MAKQRVAIIEDEALIAPDLQAGLQPMGYNVPSPSARAKRRANKRPPPRSNRVLLDIPLAGANHDLKPPVQRESGLS